MSRELNLYGDQAIATTGSHGPDIASQRLDDLDRRALRAVLESATRLTCVDLGCGRGVGGLRLALLGAEVFLYDLQDEPESLSRFCQEHRLPLRYRSGDLRAVADGGLPERIDLAYSQRFIHFLRFGQACTLLAQLAARMPQGGRFYLSATGIRSELGDGYAGAGQPLDLRFARLAPEMAAKHGILEPVCLYGEADFVRLLEEAGFKVESVWHSPFGNLKGVFARG